MGKVLWLALLVVIIAGIGLCSNLGIGGVPGGGRGIAPLNGHDCPGSHPVKGTFSRNYHTPDEPLYNASDAVVCFVTVPEAQAAGFRAPRAQ